MRRRILAGTALVLALAGCTPQLPSAVDVNLTDDWPVAFPAVQGYLPDAGTCGHSTPDEVGYLTDTFTDCADAHYGEATYVGSFPATATPTPAQWAEAYATCDAKSNAYLGGGRSWWDGRLGLEITMPSSKAWDGGARWYRCELVEINTVFDSPSYVKRRGSLRTDFPAALKIGCTKAVEKGDKIDSMPEVPCNAVHNSEYVGSYREAANTPYPKSETQWGRIHKRCQALAGTYVGVGAAAAGYFGTISTPRNSKAWAGGDHLVHCALWFSKKTMKTSAKGTSGKGLPS